MKRRLSIFLALCLVGCVALAFAGVTDFDSVRTTAKSEDTYQLEVKNSSGTSKFSVDSSGNVVAAGTLGVTGATTLTGDVTMSGALTVTGVPTLPTPNFTLGVTAKYLTEYEGWTLSAAEQKTTLIIVSSGSNGGSASIIFPATAGKMYIVRVEGGAPQLATAVVKAAAGDAGVSIAVNKTAMVIYDSTTGKYTRVTADATIER